MKVINPRGVQIDIPDEWVGDKLNQMVADGYTVVEKKVEVPEIKEIVIEQEIKDTQAVPEIVTSDLELDISVPDIKQKFIDKNGKIKALNHLGNPRKRKKKK